MTSRLPTWREWASLAGDVLGACIGYSVAGILATLAAVPAAALIWWWIGVWGLR